MQGHASAFAGHSPASDIRFVEVAESVGLGFECLQRDGVVDLISETMGCGVAWLDYDMDGDWDVYAVTGKGRPNALFRNEDGRLRTSRRRQVSLISAGAWACRPPISMATVGPTCS